MPMQIIRADITRVHADAIVNSANRAPTFAEGVDARIYEAAGAELLLTEREKIGYLEIGEACVTPAFKLSAKYIFHVSSPRWIDGNHNEVQLLRQCYDKVLQMAVENHCESIAIPLLATGNFRFPQGVGLEVATAAIREFLYDHDLDITLVVFNRRSFSLAKGITDEVKAYIDENYVESYKEGRYAKYSLNEEPWGEGPARRRISRSLAKKITTNRPTESPYVREARSIPEPTIDAEEVADAALFSENVSAQPTSFPRPSQDDDICEDVLCVQAYMVPDTWKDYESRKFVPFSDHVIRLMNKKGIEKSSHVYNACGMSKQTWAKMMNPAHNPSKTTVMQLCIGLKLNLDEARDLMMQAGYAFSPNKKEDVIIEFCISRSMDIFDTNNILFDAMGKTLSNCG